jgi:hypothetical protein
MDNGPQPSPENTVAPGALVPTGLSAEYIEQRTAIYRLIEEMGANDICVLTVMHVDRVGEGKSCQHNMVLSQRKHRTCEIVGLAYILAADLLERGTTDTRDLFRAHPLIALLAMSNRPRVDHE